MNEFIVQLKAMLDSSGIRKELSEIQKVVDSIGLDITPDVNTGEVSKKMKALLGNFTENLNIELGTNISSKDIEKAYTTAFRNVDKIIDQSTDAASKGIAELNRELQNFLKVNGSDSASVGKFFTSLEQKIEANDVAMKNLLSSIGLLDKDGKSLKRIAGGYDNLGGVIGETTTLLIRQESEMESYASKLSLKNKLDQAADAGLNVARILSLVKDETTGVFLELQETMSGKSMAEIYKGNSFINEKAINASKESILDLLNLIQKLSEYNIEVDFNPANFIMGENGKFGVIDLHTTEEGFLSLEQVVKDFVGTTVSEIKDFCESTEGMDRFLPKLEELSDKIHSITTSTPSKESGISSVDGVQPAIKAQQRLQEELKETQREAITTQDILKEAWKYAMKAKSPGGVDQEVIDWKISKGDDVSGLISKEQAVKELNSDLSVLVQNGSDGLNQLKARAGELKDSLSSVSEAVSRISKMSSIKGIPFDSYADEATKISQRLATLYDEGITDSEEFIALQYKIMKFFDKESKAAGGVKGSGAKNASELRSWIMNSWQKENPAFDRDNLVDILFGGKGGSTSIIDETNGKLISMQDIIAQISKYGKSGWMSFDSDKTELQELNTIIEYVEKNLAELQRIAQKGIVSKTDKTPVSSDNKVDTSVDDSASKLHSEEKAMESVADSAREAANAKEEFANANKKVQDSVDNSVPGLKDEGNVLDNILPSDKKFNDVLTNLDLTKSKLGEIVKITRQAHADDDGKFYESYVLKDRNGSTETYGQSSNTSKGQLIRYNYVETDVKAEERALKEIAKADEQVAKAEEKRIQELHKRLQLQSQVNQEEKASERKNSANTLLKKQQEVYANIYQVKAQIASLDKNSDTYQSSLSNLEEAKKKYQEQFIAINRQLGAYDDIINRQKQSNALDDIAKKAKKEIANIEKEIAKADGTANSEKLQNKAYNKLQDFNIKYGAYSQYYDDDFDIPNKVAKIRESISTIKTDTDLSKVNAQIKELGVSLDKVQVPKDLAREKWGNKFYKYLNENTKAAKRFGGTIEKLKKQYESIKTVGDMEKFGIDFTNYQKEVEKAGLTGLSTMDTIIKRAKSMSASFIGMYLSLYDIVRYAKNAVDTIRELDYALVDLKKTTTMTSSELNQFYYDANESAKKYGVTTKEIIDQASSWARLGYSSKEEATKMAELSSKFAAISPEMDAEQAQSGMVSIMKAWGLSVDQAEDEIISKINTLGNNFAESNADLVEGMQRSAAALAATGTTWTDAFALFTGAQEVLQNSEVAGRALRSISMRIHGYSEDSEDGLLETDEELKDITGDLIDLTKTAEHTQGVSIFKDGSTTEFKSLVDYFGEINAIWDEMSQKQQNDFLQKAFGKTQAQAGAALIQNYDAVKDSLAAMENSAGNADAEMGIVEQSIDYKINALKETWVGTIQGILKRDDIGAVADALTKFSEAIGFVIDKLGLLGTLAAGAGIFAGIKNVGRDKMYSLTCFEYADNIHNFLWIHKFRVC